MLSLMRPFPCELQPAGELQGIMLRSIAKGAGYSGDIQIIFFGKTDMWLCSGSFFKCNGDCFTHVILILHSYLCNVYSMSCFRTRCCS